MRVEISQIPDQMSKGKGPCTTRLKGAVSTFVCLIAILAASGCGSSGAHQAAPPAKPLSVAETAMLEKLEALPQEERQGFARTNYQALMQMSRENKTFADRVNAALSAQQSGERK